MIQHVGLRQHRHNCWWEPFVLRLGRIRTSDTWAFRKPSCGRSQIRPLLLARSLTSVETIAIIVAADSPALPEPLQIASLWIGFFLALTAAAATVWGARVLWRKTSFGRRHQLNRDLHGVVNGGRLERVQDRFGPALLVHDDHYTVYLDEHRKRRKHAHIHSWASADHVLRCWVDNSNRIFGWLVTSRSRAFRPTWNIGGAEVKLHQTLLGAAGGHVDSWMLGANWFGFAYHVGGGRPYAYQDVWVAVSEEGLLGEYSNLLDLMRGDPDHIRDELELASKHTSFDTLAVFDRVPESGPLHWPLLSTALQRTRA